MNTVLDDWLGELLDHTHTHSSPAVNQGVEGEVVDSAEPAVISPVLSEPVSIAHNHHTPISPVENAISPSPWAKLQIQAQQTAAIITAAETTSRWLRLHCGPQTYAVELLKVQEVVLPLPLLALRGSESALLGIMNLRGQVVPVIDLSMYLGAESKPTDSHTRIVVLEENGQVLGLRTDAVDDVVYLTPSQIEAPNHAGLQRTAHTLFFGVARIDAQPTILLNAQQLLHGGTNMDVNLV